MKKDLLQLFQEYIYECEFVAKLRHQTLLGYTQAFDTFLKYCPGLSIDSLTEERVIIFFKTLNDRKRIVGKGIVKSGIKNSTVGIYWCRLNAFCKWLELNKHIQRNPFKMLKFPRIRYEDIKYLKREDIERILTAVHNSCDNLLLLKRNLCLFYMLLFTGIRREELLLLQIRDVNFERKTLTIRADTSKSGKTRVLPLHSKLVMYLKDYIRERRSIPCQFLFISYRTNEALSFNGMKHLVAKLNKQSGVAFHLHQFRHTFAVNFLTANNNIHTLKHLLGHSDIRVTIQYLRFLPRKELRDNVEKLNIDDFI